MPTRISLRRVGETTGKKAGLPGSFAELLEVATIKLDLASPATRLFASDGDVYDADDFELISADEILVDRVVRWTEGAVKCGQCGGD